MWPAVERWWADMWANAQWVRAVKNSFFIGIFATLLSTALGTLAAIGLARSEMPYRKLVMSILISPMIIPVVITGASMFFFFSQDLNPVNWFTDEPEGGCHYVGMVSPLADTTKGKGEVLGLSRVGGSESWK